MLAQLGRAGNRRYFLDLERGGVISQAQLRAEAGIEPRTNKARVRGDPNYAIDPNIA
jgi:hypothetical protein